MRTRAQLLTLAGVAVVIATVCTGGIWLAGTIFSAGAGSTKSEIARAVDAVTMPAGLTLLDEQLMGNDFCLDDCNRLHRRYSSSLPMLDTSQRMAEALTKAGFRCTNCDGSNGSTMTVTVWQHDATGVRLSLRVSATASLMRNDPARVRPLDSSKDVHIDLEIW